MKKEIYLVSSNPNKVKEAKSILSFPIKAVHMDLTEIQSFDIKDIVRKKVQDAFDRIKKPVIVDDVGMYLDRWQGFPGPFVKFVEKLGGRSLLTLKMLEGEINRKATIKAALGYHDGKKIHVCIGTVKGRIALKERGKDGWGFDFIFIPAGKKHTFAEMGTNEKNLCSHRYKAFLKLKKILQK